MLTFHNVKMLTISGNLTTDQGLIAFLNAVPNLESLLNTAIEGDSDTDNEEDSDTDNEEDSDTVNEEDSDEEDRDEDGREEEDSDEEGREEEDSDDYKDNDSLALDIVINGCLFPRLKSVSFQEFFGDPRELRWVKLILKTAKALQTITIGYKGKGEKEFMAEIPNFPRASPGSLKDSVLFPFITPLTFILLLMVTVVKFRKLMEQVSDVRAIEVLIIDGICVWGMKDEESTCK
ncbi:hypothetical protein C5167_038331 [Papaver somniferum]|uniref:FBD domain-containing protein n=1 Tax=Papaver somniferum TaxID=3469 RepID=A0A4Y7ICK6_PAPSO|nr:hypothetical protein C5167_038331 [Papaver somniferum]